MYHYFATTVSVQAKLLTSCICSSVS